MWWMLLYLVVVLMAKCLLLHALMAAWAAIKLFRKRDALDDARREVSMHQKLAQLPASSQRWNAEMLRHDMRGELFPWIAFSHEGASLCDVLSSHGALAGDVVKPFALQLASALEALRNLDWNQEISFGRWGWDGSSLSILGCLNPLPKAGLLRTHASVSTSHFPTDLLSFERKWPPVFAKCFGAESWFMVIWLCVVWSLLGVNADGACG